MNKPLLLLSSAAMAALVPCVGLAQERYGERPPVVVSPDLSAPWVMQLERRTVAGQRRVLREMPGVTVGISQAEDYRALQRRPAARRAAPDGMQTAALAPAEARAARPQMDPMFLPQVVSYQTGHKPGTIVIDTARKFLYLVEANGMARRYGVGVGKEGFGWQGTQTISRKAEWPGWTPPAEMRVRERAKGRILPVHMEGGPENPLGARALYLGSTLYRIHGTNAPWTIGTNASSGCIRLRNEDVIDLYERVGVGTKVVVI